VTGRIAKVGDHGIRVAHLRCGQYDPHSGGQGSGLKSWAQGVAKRADIKKSKVALARMLSVVMRQMLKSGEAFSRIGPLQAAAA